MKFFLISDNMDTYTGMRLAGVEGVVVHEREDVLEALEKACANSEIAIILITSILLEMVRSTVYEKKLAISQPLIVEVADRHGKGKVTDSISRYIREAVGIKI